VFETFMAMHIYVDALATQSEGERDELMPGRGERLFEGSSTMTGQRVSGAKDEGSGGTFDDVEAIHISCISAFKTIFCPGCFVSQCHCKSSTQAKAKHVSRSDTLVIIDCMLNLIVLRIQSRTRKLCTLPDNLFDRIEEIPLSSHLSSRSNRKHTSLERMSAGLYRMRMV
jgi:hypothetical protein